MTKENAIKLFEDKKIRTVWDNESEEWYISIIDVIQVLTGNERPRKYWGDLKRKLTKEGSELSEKNRTVENVSGGRKNETNRCGRCRATFSFNTIHTFSQS